MKLSIQRQSAWKWNVYRYDWPTPDVNEYELVARIVHHEERFFIELVEYTDTGVEYHRQARGWDLYQGARRAVSRHFKELS